MILYLKSIRGGPVKKKHPVIVYEAMALKWIKKKDTPPPHRRHVLPKGPYLTTFPHIFMAKMPQIVSYKVPRS